MRTGSRSRRSTGRRPADSTAAGGVAVERTLLPRAALARARPEFVHGYRDEDGVQPAAPPAPYGSNGTFMVFRKLRQDVAAFRACGPCRPPTTSTARGT